MLRTFHPENPEKITTNEPQPRFTGSYRKVAKFNFYLPNRATRFHNRRLNFIIEKSPRTFY